MGPAGVDKHQGIRSAGSNSMCLLCPSLAIWSAVESDTGGTTKDTHEVVVQQADKGIRLIESSFPCKDGVFVAST